MSIPLKATNIEQSKRLHQKVEPFTLSLKD